MAKRISFELAVRSGHDFQNYFALILGELIEGTAETKRLGHLDRKGVDAVVLDADNETINTVIQCKGFEVAGYPIAKHHQCRQDCTSYQHLCRSFWLAHGRI